MKKLLLLGIAVLGFQFSTAQEIFEKNTVFVDAQTEVASTGGRLGVGVHWGISPAVSIGTTFSYNTIDPKEDWFTAYIPEVSVDYHFGKRQRTDWYAGASAGYCFWLSDEPYSKRVTGGLIPELEDKHRRSFIWNAHIGFRSFIYRNIGIVGQVGVGNVYSVKIGVCARF